MPRQWRAVARSPAQVRAALWPQLDRCAIVSFDVFDTLIQRRIDSPSIVHRQSAIWLAQRLAEIGTTIAPHQLLAVRSICEQHLRAVHTAAGADPECSLGELLSAVLDECLPSDSPERSPAALRTLADEAVAAEIELERAVIEPIAGMQDLFNEVRSTGRRVILTSDMYLPACGMRTLLESAGYDLTGVWLCVSSEVGLLKATGRLYRHWLAAEDTRAAAAVHIGDDFHVDYVAAWRAGLSTIHFASPAASRRRLAALSPWQRACEGFRRLRARLGMTLDAWKHC